MSDEEKKQSVRTKQVTHYSAKFGDFASSSLQLFLIWSKDFAFLYLYLAKLLSELNLCMTLLY